MELIAFRIPMKVRFRGVSERCGILIGGPAGWGEFSPFPEYPSSVAAHWARAALAAANDGWPRPLRKRIPVNATIPAVSPELAYEMALSSGCTTAKVKVAEGDDMGRVEAVREALGPDGKIRVDANGIWDTDEAVRSIRSLARFTLEYVEQPVSTLDEMAAVRKKVDVPLAADESVRNADDPLRIAGLEAADIVVLKVQPLGGVQRCLEVAEACGLPVVVSSAVETSIGLASGLALAAALEELPYACGLNTLSLLEGDVADKPFVALNGQIAVRRPEVDPELAERFAPPVELEREWKARLHEAMEALN
jgi:o-succinylbenzoate synthase